MTCAEGDAIRGYARQWMALNGAIAAGLVTGLGIKFTDLSLNRRPLIVVLVGAALAGIVITAFVWSWATSTPDLSFDHLVASETWRKAIEDRKPDALAEYRGSLEQLQRFREDLIRRYAREDPRDPLKEKQLQDIEKQVEEIGCVADVVEARHRRRVLVLITLIPQAAFSVALLVTLLSLQPSSAS